MPGTRTAIDRNVAKFFPIDESDVYVLGTNGILWLESAPFGTVPPSRFEVASGVWSCKQTSVGQLLVLKADATLWLYQRPNPKAVLHPFPIQIDANVRDFYSWDGASVFVLGLNGHLWLESAPFGNVPPSRVSVDEGVQAFTPWFGSNIQDLGALVLGSQTYDWPLLLELPPFGSLPPSNMTLVDKNVAQFVQFDFQTIYVLGTNGNLWIESAPFGVAPPSRVQIDGDVKTFRGPNPDFSVYVLSADANATLWLEFPSYGGVPPPRVQIDSNIATLEALNEDQVYVLDKQGALWFWTGPFSWMSESSGPGSGGPDQGDPGAGDGGGGVVSTPGMPMDPPDNPDQPPSTSGM
jgi:hypothetical protein